MIINEILYKTTGIMTKKCIMKKCTETGRKISEMVAKNGKADADELTKVITDTLGKRKSKKIGLVFDKQEAIDAYMKNLGAAEQQATRDVSRCAGISIPKCFGEKTVWCFPMDSGKQSYEIANVPAHEFEHALYQTFSPKILIGKAFIKIKMLLGKLPFGKKQMNNFINKANKMNRQNLDVQSLIIDSIGELHRHGYTKYPATTDGLLKHMECKNIDELHERIVSKLYHSDALSLKDDKSNIERILVWIQLLKDESRAYKIGGQSERYYRRLVGDISENATGSEMISLLYDETINALKKELKFVKRHYGETKIGIKPDRRREIGLWRQEQKRFCELPEMSSTIVVKKELTEKEQSILNKIIERHKHTSPTINPEAIESAFRAGYFDEFLDMYK